MRPEHLILLLPLVVVCQAGYFFFKWLRLGISGVEGHESNRAEEPGIYFLNLFCCFLFGALSVGFAFIMNQMIKFNLKNPFAAAPFLPLFVSWIWMFRHARSK
jgi:uncharacterized membrane protein YfcA